MSIIRTVALSFLIATTATSSVAQCQELAGWFSGDEWLGFYYPDRGNLARFHKSEPLTSLDECRAWVDSERAARGATGLADDYECGVNCRPMAGSDMFMCDRTEQ